MPQQVEFDGTIHEFPDDFSEAEIAAALGAVGEKRLAAPIGENADISTGNVEPVLPTYAPIPQSPRLGLQGPPTNSLGADLAAGFVAQPQPPKSVRGPAPESGGLGQIVRGVGPALTGGAEIGAGLGGVAVGSIFGIPNIGMGVGATLGSYTGELARLAIGRLSGQIGPDVDIEALAAQRAYGTAVSTAITIPAVKLASRIVLALARSGDVGRLQRLTQLHGDEVQKGLEELAPIAAETEARTGQTLAPTTAQVAPGVTAEEFANAGPQTRAQVRAQGQTVAPALQEALAPEAAPIARETFGARVQETLTPPLELKTQAAAADISGAQRSVAAAVDALRSTAENPQAAVQTALEAIRTARREALNATYGQIEASAADLQAQPSNLRSAGARWVSTFKQDIAPRLRPEDAAVAEQLMRARTTDETRALAEATRARLGFPPLVSTTTTENPTDLFYLNRFIHSIREEIRDSIGFRGLIARRDRGMLDDLEAAALADRAQLLSGRPELLRALNAADAGWLAFRNEMDRSVLGTIIARDEGGRWKLAAEDAIPKLLGDPEGAKLLSGLFARPEFAEWAGAREAIRKGIFDLYTQRVLTIDPLTGKQTVNLAAHRAFTRDYILREGPATEFLLPRDISALRAPGSAAQALALAEQRARDLKIELSKRFDYRTNELDAAGMFAHFWGRTADTLGGRPAETAQLRALLISRGRGDVWSDFQRLAQQEIAESVSVRNPEAQALVPDYTKLAALLGSPSRMAMVRDTLGADYVKDLTLAANAMRFLDRAGLPSGETSDAFTKALMSVIRARIGMFTAKGRTLSSYRYLSDASFQRTMDRAMADPAYFAWLARMNAAYGPAQASAALAVSLTGTNDRIQPLVRWTAEKGAILRRKAEGLMSPSPSENASQAP